MCQGCWAETNVDMRTRGSYSSHFAFFPPLLTHITCVTKWNKHSFQRFIRNLSTMDHWFLCITQLFALLGIMGIVSRLLTVSGLVSLVSPWQHVSALTFGFPRHWIPLIRVRIFSTVFPQTPHLESVCGILGGPAGLVFVSGREWLVFHVSLFSPSVSESL